MKTVLPDMQFKITLLSTDPLVWRRIVVPHEYSFWDLHVAIQDSMGWLDYHLHEFRLSTGQGKIRIGIPGPGRDDDLTPGWDVKIISYFNHPGNLALYEYDFGDGWLHDVVFEALRFDKPGTRSPRCIAGERACPPEDCGSISGYAELVKILKNPGHKRYAEMASWLRGHAKNYWPFDPLAFNPRRVRFDDPGERYKKSIEDGN
jgi:hypothetical protein